MPCNPSDVTINIPDGPSGPHIPGFGTPYALPIPDIAIVPNSFPEDLLDLLNKFQFLIPSGALKPSLNPNFSKDIFDAIMDLLDKFFPFLMLYKFFLPILNIIICIIEVLCSLTNPFKVVRALKRLFRVCIPEFLNLFPIFALIIMIISLLLLLLALIEYIIEQILKLIKTLLRNINALVKAFNNADKNAIIAIAKKIGSLLCAFQNLFVLLSLFNIIIQIFKDILGMLFSIPPCDDSTPDDADACCTPDVCPAIIKNSNYTRVTGQLQYFKQYGFDTGTVIPGFGNINYDLRTESWQLFDNNQELAQKFINIVDAYDVPGIPSVPGFPPNLLPGLQFKPTFFPTDVSYDQNTSPKQAAYTVDVKLTYNPANWGRAGSTRTIVFKDCIMKLAPTTLLKGFDNSTTEVSNGVVYLVGGLGYEEDGTILTGFEADGVTPITNQATLNNFLHMPSTFSVTPTLANDGVLFTDVEYTFKPNLPTLISKNLVTAGCEPTFALNRAYVSNILAGDIGLKIAQLNQTFNGSTNQNGDFVPFPNPLATQECLQNSITALRANLTTEGVAEFQSTATLCLETLKEQTNQAIISLIGIGFEACSSTYSLEPSLQFTSQPITVSVELKERNKLSLTSNLPSSVADELAKQIKGHVTFGSISDFTYDGSGLFTANITSDIAGKGDLMISFDNNTFCVNNLPENIDEDPSRTLQSLAYQFVYTPAFTGKTPETAEGDTDGKADRNIGSNG